MVLEYYSDQKATPDVIRHKLASISISRDLLLCNQGAIKVIEVMLGVLSHSGI